MQTISLCSFRPGAYVAFGLHSALGINLKKYIFLSLPLVFGPRARRRGPQIESGYRYIFVNFYIKMDIKISSIISAINRITIGFLHELSNLNGLILPPDFYHFIAFNTIKKTFKEFRLTAQIKYTHVFYNNIDDKTSFRMSVIYLPEHNILINPYLTFMYNRGPFNYSESTVPKYKILDNYIKYYVNSPEDVTAVAYRFYIANRGAPRDSSEKNEKKYYINQCARLFKGLIKEHIVHRLM